MIGEFCKELVDNVEKHNKEAFENRVVFMIGALERECRMRSECGHKNATMYFSGDTTTDAHIEEFLKRVFGDPKNVGLSLVEKKRSEGRGAFILVFSWENAAKTADINVFIGGFMESISIGLSEGRNIAGALIENIESEAVEQCKISVIALLDDLGISPENLSVVYKPSLNKAFFVVFLPKKDEKA